VIARRQLTLRFRKVEGGAIGFGVCRHQVDKERDKLKAAKEVPAQQAVSRLQVHNLVQVERTGAQHHAHQRQAKSKLIADQLRA